MTGRIVFPGNPWPDGHAIKDFQLLAALRPGTSVRVLMHLQTEDYDAARKIDYDDDHEHDSVWEASRVWGNYHNCVLSATHWGIDGSSGFPVHDASARFDVDALAGTEFCVDHVAGERIDIEDDQLAFHLYLLGHDTAADHRIAFNALGSGRFAINWSGRIALTYVGSTTLRHAFKAHIPDTPFLGVTVLDCRSLDEAKAALARHVAHPEHFVHEPRSRLQNWFAYRP
jgi:hypothetical protein